MTSFQRQFGAGWTCVDERGDIGPHHLAIGKTRKLFEMGNTIEAFYSEGYAIAHARLDAGTLERREAKPLPDFPVAWGGGAFCVDADDKGRVTLVFVHRNRHEFCVVQGTASAEGIVWGGWKTLLATAAPQAAAWVETGPDGTAWCSVLARDGDFRLALVAPDGSATTALLFEANESPWYHSCVQVLPVGADEAVAVGFRGAFPAKTELVFKTVTRGFVLGPSQTLAPCNVNDQFTFHFQAVGDPANGRAHIVYLDDGLSVSHAVYEKGAWHVDKNVMPFPSYAPQICIDDAGRLALLACDYEGAVWTASWRDRTGWTKPRAVEALPASTISGLFGRTGYGTGGLICAARSPSGRVPFLMGAITDERTARARLYAASLGLRGGLLLDAGQPVAATLEGAMLKGEIRLASLRKSDFETANKSWVVNIPVKEGAPAKLTIALDAGRPLAHLSRCTADGYARVAPAKVTAQFRDPFSQEAACAAIAFEAECPADMTLIPEKAWVETYDAAGGETALVDLAPFEPEAAAQTTLAPHRIPAIYKRMV
jgi:hypothetical protein